MDRFRKNGWRAASALVVTLLAGACSDSTGPGEEGRVNAVLTDDPAASLAEAAPSRAAEPAASSFQGEMTGTARAYIYSEAHGWVALGLPASASMTLQSADHAAVHEQASAPAGTYTRVRLVLEGAAADIAAGADLGGLVLDASVRITLGGGDATVEIEKNVPPFTVSASSTATVRFDLNSQAWVNQATAEAKAAADAEIQSATTAQVTAS